MLFNSFNFLVFFPIVVIVYLGLPKRIRYIWLLIASYFFYMCWNPKYIILIVFSTFVTYLSSIFIDKLNHSDRANIDFKKKIVVAGSFIINIGILIFFKYFDFLLSNINIILKQFHMLPIENHFNIILPVGISFFTFQALSYTVDVYRGDVEVERNFFKYALFVSFFPQLVAGPIERSKNLVKQINIVPYQKLWNFKRISNGLVIMLWGYFLKLVIADRTAILVNTVFDNFEQYGMVQLILAAFGFALQIYCDFSSYSTIAIGAAQVMGFRLMENFNTPYFARSVPEFWRRWHISLSTWFKDYLYIPLGGNRCSRWRNRVNLMITFLVSGLWHGADWTYIIWGALHGFYQIIGKMTVPLKKKVNQRLHTKTESISYQLGQIIITFLLVSFAWIFFRANSVSDAFQYIYRIFSDINPWTLFDGSLYTLGLEQKECMVLIVSIIILLLVDLVKFRRNQQLDVFLGEQCIWFRWGVLIILFFMTILFGIYGSGYNASQFIYFQF